MVIARVVLCDDEGEYTEAYTKTSCKLAKVVAYVPPGKAGKMSGLENLTE